MKDLIQKIVLVVKRALPQDETGDQMRERINRQLREYNVTGIASIKFIKGAWYE
jgi:hypothetical protein